MDKLSCDLYLPRYHGSHGTMGNEYMYIYQSGKAKHLTTGGEFSNI